MGTFGSRLREFRKYKKLTQDGFAKRCGGVTEQSHISHWETDLVKPDADNLQMISIVFPDLNIEWLRSGNNNMLNDEEKIKTGDSDSKIIELEKELALVKAKYLKSLEDYQNLSMRFVQGS